MSENKAKAAAQTSPGQPLGMDSGMHEAVKQLREAAAAKKCWPCGCLHNSLTWIERAFPPDKTRPEELDAAIREARARLVEVRYDCLGCQICYPALAINALNTGAESATGDLEICPTEKVGDRAG